ncbi:MAG: amidohydrolase family protein [Chloroflexi bacterium]|nr:amidohydrolase family protein [Chloroflexota bacterium]
MPAILLTNATLLDATGKPPLKDAAVIVDGEKIAWAGPKAQAQARPEVATGQATVIDLKGKTLMPGMMDVHVHICQGTDPNPGGELTDILPLHAIRGVVNARAFLDAGFTTVRNVGSPGYADVALKQAIARGLVPGPRILASGWMLFTEGSGERGYMRPEVHVEEPGMFVGVEGARRAVRMDVYNGADIIKLVASGRVGSNAFTMPWDTELTRDEMAAVADEAHRLGKKVAAHAYAPHTVADCVLAGIDSIEHGVMIDEPTIALMAERGTALVPTMSPFHNYLQPGAEQRFPAYRLERGRPMAQLQRKNFPLYLSYGLKIATGSDGPRPGSLPGTTALELQLMVEAGMPPMQAVQAATKTAAEVIGMADRLGTIEAGKLADLIVVDGDPLADVRVLQGKERIKLVMKGGQVFRNSL